MSIFGAGLVFVMILCVYGVISEVFTVLFRLTGMPEKKARFQVVSMLTNSGYTTAESEFIVGDDRRRGLAQKTMLFGYVFSVTIVSALVNVLLSMKLAQLEELLWSLPLPIILVVAYLILRKKENLRVWYSRRIDALAARILSRSEDNDLLVIDSYGKSIIAEVHVAHLPPALRNVSLKESGLRDMGVNVMFIKRKGEEAIPASGDTLLREDDVAVVFGRPTAIEQAMGLRDGQARRQSAA